MAFIGTPYGFIYNLILIINIFGGKIMDVDAKVTIIHVIGGIIAAFLSVKLTTGTIMGFGGETVAVLLGLVILYLCGQVSERLLGKEEVGGLKGWLWSGIVPYLAVWLVIWILLFNYNPIPPIQ
jgi:EMC6-arch